MTSPEIETDATDPVIVGTTDGTAEVGKSDGDIVGSKVGAEVMKTSQKHIMLCDNPIKVISD